MSNFCRINVDFFPLCDVRLSCTRLKIAIKIRITEPEFCIFFQAFVASPMELVKTQMQVRPECNKVSDTVKSIVERAGYKGLLRGLGTTIVREVPAVGIYFSSFEVFSKLRQDSEAWIFVSGGLAGIASWVFTYPQDVVKSRLQADAFGKDASYRGPWHCFKASLAAEGPKMLFRGMGSTVIRY